MNREMGGGGEDWPIGQLLDLEASNLDQREEEQKERWRLGEKARGRQTAERGGGAKEISGVRWSLCCSLVSDGQTEADRKPGPGGLLN